MGTNRQPKDKLLQFTKIMEKTKPLYEDALALEEAKRLGLYVSKSKEGKIKDLSSINVMPLESCFQKWLGHCSDCNVCKHCYACGALSTYRQNVLKVLVRNTVLLSRPLKNYEIPLLLGPVRIYAFGDCHNATMANNTILIAKRNLHTATVVVITKQYHYYYGYRSIPKNMVIVGSNSIINDVSPILKPNVHKTYAVVTDLEFYRNKPNYYICDDQCINCYLNHKGCFSRKGPRVIVRLLQ